MSAADLPTAFLSADRATAESVHRDFVEVSHSTLLRQILGIVPDAVLILNSERQIVYCNDDFLRLISEPILRKVLGLRHGEAMGCVMSEESSGGCGTAESCRECGVAKGIVIAQALGRSYVESRIVRKGGETLRLRMWSNRLDLNGRAFTACVARLEPGPSA